MAAGDELQARCRPHGIGGEQARRAEIGAVHSFHRAGGHPRKARARSVQEEVLPISVKRNAPRIRDAELRMAREFLGARAVAEEAAIGAAHGAVHRLHIAMQKHALGHVDRPGCIHAKRRDCVVCIVVIKAA